MKKLLVQFMKFGVVGVICFLIDFGLYTLCNAAGIPYLISGAVGFIVSVVVNYLLSMRFVFTRRDDISRKREFIIYVILSAIGLGLHELILYVCVEKIYPAWPWLNSRLALSPAKLLAKIGATGLVLIYNFVTRKIFLENKGRNPAATLRSFL